MSIVNLKHVTQAIENILNTLDGDYSINRNPERNSDPNVAAKGDGWIGIYRGNVSYEAMFIGATPWVVSVEPEVEIQVASMNQGGDAEDAMENALAAIMAKLNANKSLNDTVAMTNGYKIAYDVNKMAEATIYSATITIIAEVRA